MGVDGKSECRRHIAGQDWFMSYMGLKSCLSQRKSQWISAARATAMNRTDAAAYSELLTKLLVENDLLESPSSICNVDECGLELNNVPDKAVAMKRIKNVHVLISAGKGQIAAATARPNNEGKFLPPLCVFKSMSTKS